MKRIFRIPQLLWLACGLLGIAQAEPSATAIIRQGETNRAGETSQSLLTILVERANYTRLLKLRSWTSRTQTLVQVIAPESVAGLSVLRLGNHYWEFNPVQQTMRVIPNKSLDLPWFGTDLTLQELTRSESIPSPGNPQVIRRTHKYLLIERRTGSSFNAQKTHHWVRTKDHLPIQTKFYDSNGNWKRTIDYSDFHRMDDRIVPTKIAVTFPQPNKTTCVTYQRILFNRAISPEVFDPGRLGSFSTLRHRSHREWSFRRLKLPHTQLANTDSQATKKPTSILVKPSPLPSTTSVQPKHLK